MNFTEMFRRLKHRVKAEAMAMSKKQAAVPGNAQERIDICLKNYFRAKVQYQNSRRRGNIREYISYQKDMEYWETYLQECGGLSLRVPHPPYGGSGSWNSHEYTVRRMAAKVAREAFEKEGYPYGGPYVDVPEMI